jgi:hypothetical protein
MDADRFDALSRLLSSARSRRAILSTVLGALAGGAITAEHAPVAAAKRRRTSSRRQGEDITTRSHTGCVHAGLACTANSQCCTGRCLTGKVCSCDRSTNLCPKAKNPCKTIVCNAEGRCVTKNRVAGAVCSSDGTVCTKDICDGQGTCTHPPDTAKNGTGCESDGNPCTKDVCKDGVCRHPRKANGVSCGDGKVCHDGECCTPDCAAKFCGSDGCGGSCGECASNQTCSIDTCCPLGHHKSCEPDPLVPGGDLCRCCDANMDICNGECCSPGTCFGCNPEGDCFCMPDF